MYVHVRSCNNDGRLDFVSSQRLSMCIVQCNYDLSYYYFSLPLSHDVRAIKSLESRISTHSDQTDSPQGQEKEEGEGEGEANLMLIPDGPPNWTQCQRQPHNYEEVTILDDSSPEEYPRTKMQRRQLRKSTRSVGNLHMVWDESDIRYYQLQATCTCIHVHVHACCALP